MIKKIIKSDKKITPWGGIFFVIDLLKRKGIDKLIDSELGQRAKQAKFSFSDIITSWMCANLCGAERLEDVHHFRRHTKGVSVLNVPSSDTLSRIMRSLASKSYTTSSKKKEFQQ